LNVSVSMETLPDVDPSFNPVPDNTMLNSDSILLELVDKQELPEKEVVVVPLSVPLAAPVDSFNVASKLPLTE